MNKDRLVFQTHLSTFSKKKKNAFIERFYLLHQTLKNLKFQTQTQIS